MEKDNYSQQELFEQKKYISDLIEEDFPTDIQKLAIVSTSLQILTFKTTHFIAKGTNRHSQLSYFQH